MFITSLLGYSKVETVTYKENFVLWKFASVKVGFQFLKFGKG